jgi:hypothetical protein
MHVGGGEIDEGDGGSAGAGKSLSKVSRFWFLVFGSVISRVAKEPETKNEKPATIPR